MAYDKVIDSLKLDADLTSVADAIRTKSGTKGELDFPDGFVSAVEEIQTESFPVIQPISITGNGTYEAPDGVDGYNPVTVAIESVGGGAKPETGFVPTAWTTYDYVGNISMVGRIMECDYYGTTLGEYYFGVSSNYAEQFTHLSNIVFKDAIATIGVGAFYGCTKLSITSLPESLQTIYANAFYKCTSLTEITFEGTPYSIESSAFNRCTNLLTINVPWAEGEVANAPWGATNATINYNYTGG